MMGRVGGAAAVLAVATVSKLLVLLIIVNVSLSFSAARRGIGGGGLLRCLLPAESADSPRFMSGFVFMEFDDADDGSGGLEGIAAGFIRSVRKLFNINTILLSTTFRNSNL